MIVKILSVIGAVLQFFSFWLAAPELLGQNTLERFEKGIQRFFKKLPVLIVNSIGMFSGIGVGLYSAIGGFNASKNHQIDRNQYLLIIGVITLLLIVYGFFFYKKFKKWAEQKFAASITRQLIENTEVRKTLLIIAAILFTTGFIVQIIAIILG